MCRCRFNLCATKCVGGKSASWLEPQGPKKSNGKATAQEPSKEVWNQYNGKQWQRPLMSYRDCCISLSPPDVHPGRSRPWPDIGSPVRTPWRHPSPSAPRRFPSGPLRAGCSRTSCPPVGRCTCRKGNTASRSGGTSECSYNCPSSCSSLWEWTQGMTQADVIVLN